MSKDLEKCHCVFLELDVDFKVFIERISFGLFPARNMPGEYSQVSALDWQLLSEQQLELVVTGDGR